MVHGAEVAWRAAAEEVEMRNVQGKWCAVTHASGALCLFHRTTPSYRSIMQPNSATLWALLHELLVPQCLTGGVLSYVFVLHYGDYFQNHVESMCEINLNESRNGVFGTQAFS